MQAQVKEWGNGQGVRLSKEILKSAGITLNDIGHYGIKWHYYSGKTVSSQNTGRKSCRI